MCELFRLEECVFLSIMRTYGLIRHKITGGKSSYTIEHLKWDTLLSQYELRDVEISTSKLTVIGGNKIGRICHSFVLGLSHHCRIRNQLSNILIKFFLHL